MASGGLTVSDKVSWSPSQLATEVEGEVVVLSIEQGAYYGLNDTGSDIWRKLKQPIAVAQICDELGEAYEGDSATITKDVLTLLDRMLQDGLIQRAA